MKKKSINEADVPRALKENKSKKKKCRTCDDKGLIVTPVLFAPKFNILISCPNCSSF